MQFQGQMWDQAQNHIEKNVIPSVFYSFHLISFARISRGPSHHKKCDLNNKYYGCNSTSQSTARKSAANVRTPSVTSSEPLPKQLENPSEATAVLRWPCPPWPPQRSAARPRRPRRSRAAAMQCRLSLGRLRMRRGRRAMLRLPSRNKAYNHGMFLQVVGQNSEYRSKY